MFRSWARTLASRLLLTHFFTLSPSRKLFLVQKTKASLLREKKLKCTLDKSFPVSNRSIVKMVISVAVKELVMKTVD